MRRSGFEGFHKPFGHFPGLDGCHELLDFGIAEQRGRVALDEADVAGAANVVRHRGLEFAFAPEHYQRDQFRFVYAQKFL